MATSLSMTRSQASQNTCIWAVIARSLLNASVGLSRVRALQTRDRFFLIIPFERLAGFILNR